MILPTGAQHVLKELAAQRSAGAFAQRRPHAFKLSPITVTIAVEIMQALALTVHDEQHPADQRRAAAQVHQRLAAQKLTA